MILTVTINPLLEKRYIYNRTLTEEYDRSWSEELRAGGKGINVSRQLNRLGLKNIAFTFLGGNDGKILRDLLFREKINFTFIRTNSGTRNASVIVDRSNQTITTLFGSNSVITEEEAEEFKTKLEKMIRNCEIVIFSGSSPCETADTIFPFGIQTANRYDKISICDTYGEHLRDCIDSAPTIIHNNVEETEKSLKLKLQTEKEKTDYLDFLYSKNVKQAYLTNGGSESFCSNFDYHFKINPPKINSVDSTGSGDSFVAGIAFGWHNNLTFEETLTLATSLGTANSISLETSNVALTEAEKLRSSIVIEPVGKKMKTVDVTPN